MKKVKESFQRRRGRRHYPKSEEADKPDESSEAPESPQAPESSAAPEIDKVLESTPSEIITYRVRCLPTQTTFASAKDLLETALNVSKDGSIAICSLAYSTGYSGAKTAIIRARGIFLKSNESENQWNVRILAENNELDEDRLRTKDIVIDTHFEGLTPFNSYDDELKHQINVVAITGLAGHAFRSFKERRSDFMWLMDALPSDLEGAQIWTYGYDTKLVDSSSFQDLEALASTFRRSLMSLVPSNDRKVIPLVLIGHSLGGLILKEALIQISNDPAHKAALTYQAIYGLLLFGCPNQGMDISSLVPMCEGQVNLPFLFDLGRSSERLRQLCRVFPQAFAFPDSRIISFYETKLSPTAIEESPGVWKMNGPLAVLVDPPSATHGRPEENQAHNIQGINRTHSELVKFSRQDLDYNVVLGFLQEFKLAAPSVIEMRVRRGVVHDVTSNITRPQQQLRQNEICKWLAPVDSEQGCDHYLEDLDDARFLRHPDTCQWIKPKPEYEKWSACQVNSQTSLLWIHAIPGAGKTVLASYMVDSAAESQSSPILFFFFKNGDSDKNTAIAALRSFMYQLLQTGELASRQDLCNELQQCKEKAAHSRAVNFKQLWDVFARVCALRNGLIIILDALDECRDVSKLLPSLLRLANTKKVKIAFTSRREAELIEALKGVPSLAMGPEDVRDDIKVYVDYRVANSGNLSDPRVHSRIVRILNAQSKGMFLWVRLMVDELESCVTINQVEDTLSSLPEGLPEVYQRILRRLQSSLKRARKDLCSRILKWLVLAKRPLQLREVNEALRLEYANVDGGPAFAQNLLCSDRDVESICGSLVTVKKQIIELIHLSAKEFLLVPTETSILNGGLEYFLVDLGQDSAGIASSCTRYLRSTGAFNEISPTGENNQIFKQSYPLIEYACFHWISHIVDSTTSAMADQKDVLREFIVSRHPFSWIEIYFTFRRHSKSEVCFEIQKLLEWATLDDIATPLSCHVTDTLLLFSAWARAFLRLLNDYGAMLDFQPDLVHQIDPERFCHSTDIQMLEAFRESTAIQRHCSVRAAPNLANSPNIPDHRKLQKLANDSDGIALCHFCMKRDAVFTVAANPGAMPQFYCQEITTGRKLMPIVDKEFVDNNRPIFAKAAVMSQGANYLAIQYDWHENEETQSSYLVVWALDSNLNFGQRRHQSWAQKVFSSLNVVKDVNDPFMSLSKRPITFDADGNLHTLRGQLKITTGEETPSVASALEGFGSLTLSGNGKFAILDDFGADLIYKTMDGDTKSIPDSASLMPDSFHDISHTGRFVAWEFAADDDPLQDTSTDIQINIFDTHTKKTTNLLIPDEREIQFIVRVGGNFEFAEDESILFGFIPRWRAALTQNIAGITRFDIVYVWKRHGDEFTLWNSKAMPRQILGWYYDTIEQHLYIVEPGPVWNRIDLTSSDLRDLNEDVPSTTVPYSGLGHRVSSTGSHLATIGTSHNRSQATIEEFEIDTGTCVFDIVPNISNSSAGPYLFSPNLKYLFIRSLIVVVPSLELRIIGKNISLDVIDGLVTPSREIQFQYDFSPNSSHFAFSSYITDIDGGKIQLRIWSMDPDRDLFIPFMLPEKLDSSSSNCILSDYNMVGFDFHPQSTSIILSLWRKTALPGNSPSSSYTMTCLILDLRSADLIEVEPTSSNAKQVFAQIYLLPKETDFIARFSVDGFYAVLDPNRGSDAINHSHRFGIFYRVPENFGLPSPPIIFTENSVLPPWWHQYGLSFRISREGCGEQKSVIAISLNIAKGTSLEKLKLTYVPEYLRHASVTLMVEDKGQERAQGRLKLLFWMRDGGIELIHINRTFPEVLVGSKLWRKHGGREIRGKDLRIERLEDTDSEVEEQDRHKSEGRLMRSAQVSALGKEGG